MKTTLIIFILYILWLPCGPANSSPWTSEVDPWEPPVKWVIEYSGGEYPFRAFQQGEYLKFEVKPGHGYYPERIYAAEIFLHYALEDHRQFMQTIDSSIQLLSSDFSYEPNLTFTWPEILTSLYPAEINTDHFCWPYDPNKPYDLQVGRIIAFERLIYYATNLGKSTSEPIHESTHPVPEPMSLLLLGSGLIGIIAVRRRKKPLKAEKPEGKSNEFNTRKVSKTD